MNRISTSLATLILMGFGYFMWQHMDMQTIDPLIRLNKIDLNKTDLNKVKSVNISSGKKSLPNSIQGYFNDKKERRNNGHAKLDSPGEYAKIERDRRTPSDLSSPEYSDNYRINELHKAKSSKYRSPKSGDLNFIERGPGNVAGRTRALLVLPSDRGTDTWIAGSASGGIWKTTDAGMNWIDKTPDLPNLGTNTLAMSSSNGDIIYAGTGEHFTRDIDGAGMFKSTDQGETWTQIVAPGDYDAFRNVSRIVVHPDDPNIVIATTRNSVFEDSLRAAIYKSIDGGLSWDLKLLSTEDRYDDIAVNTQNFNTLYVAVRREGVLKSKDQGETWTKQTKGLMLTGRIEIATSTVDTNYVWGSAEGSGSGSGSDLYISKDGGESWNLAVEEGEAINFLDGQGWYDNVIEPHPFFKDVVYVGGVNLFKMQLSNGEVADILYDVVDNGVFDFIDFVNGANVGGGFIEGSLEPEEIVSIEVRFGVGSQMAHRFSVNGQGAGVPAGLYLYQDLVEVPFQVWDITNNRQLMVSFRDQQEDGAWNLIERSLTSSDPSTDSREYIFIHNKPYSDTAHVDIAQDGGQEFQQLFLLWPVLRGGQIFNPTDTVSSSFSILAELTKRLTVTSTVISDAYGDFNGNNSFSSSEFASNTGHHPDQHSLQHIIFDSLNRSFRLLTTNDGGVYLSNVSGDPGASDGAFRYAGFSYNTSQFYSADKMPGEDRYIGGMQDNSTWFTAANEAGSAESFYEFAFGGDGFEAIWNNRNPDLMIGSSQFNGFLNSINRGQTWVDATSGIGDTGPFVSRLANSRAIPDRLFTIGTSGVWISNDFGSNWTSSPIGAQWSFNNSADIEVSTANPEVVWAGGAMDESERLFVSTDAGHTFKATSNYQKVELGTVSGIGVHPTDENTAYALFSFARRSKVLRTRDLGQTWHDLSGYDGISRTSSNGFPDVATNCLLVFPNDTSRIWVGTEIGIIESLDNGDTWHLLDENIPAVNVYDLKVQDDQIVIATYGRGIWSVQIDGIQRTHIFPPTIVSVGVHPSGSLQLGADLSSDFDSLQLEIDDALIDFTLPMSTTGNMSVTLSGIEIDDGVHRFNLIGYKDNIGYKSFAFEGTFFKPYAPVDQYFNDFSVDSLLNDFIGEGFSVRLEDNFEDLAIHSDHDYNNQREITYQLKRPIIVSEEQAFKYRDVVIVETGAPLSTFGNDNFFDFVVVEGSSDGIAWVPLFDGYDSSFDTNWNSTYEAEQDGRASLYINHSVDLLDKFDVGDIIFIRYRLFADPFANGWGWAIDDVEVSKDNTTPVYDPEFASLSIFPNPANDVLFIQLPDKINSRIIITDLQGRLMKIQPSSQTNSRLKIETTSFTEGIYFVNIYNEGKLVATEKIVVVR